MNVVQVSLELTPAPEVTRTALPIIAMVLDEDGCPLPDHTVKFGLVGDGVLWPSGSARLVARTDRLGEAVVTWEPASVDGKADQRSRIIVACQGVHATTIRLRPGTTRQAGDLPT